MTYHAFVSPQGHVKYNAAFVVDEANLHKLTPGRWYTPQVLADFFGFKFSRCDYSACICECDHNAPFAYFREYRKAAMSIASSGVTPISGMMVLAFIFTTSAWAVKVSMVDRV